MSASFTPFSLRALHARLGEIIRENDAAGRSMLNDLPAGIRIVRHGVSGRNLGSRCFLVRAAYGSLTVQGRPLDPGLTPAADETTFCGVVEAFERTCEVVPAAKRAVRKGVRS